MGVQSFWCENAATMFVPVARMLGKLIAVRCAAVCRRRLKRVLIWSENTLAAWCRCRGCSTECSLGILQECLTRAFPQECHTKSVVPGVQFHNAPPQKKHRCENCQRVFTPIELSHNVGSSECSPTGHAAFPELSQRVLRTPPHFLERSKLTQQ